MSPRSARPESGKLAALLARIYDLPQTASRIVDVLAEGRKKLGVRQLVARVRRSERSVRHALSVLVRKGILEREVTVTATKKLAYVYSLTPLEHIVQGVREEFSHTVTKLEEMARSAAREVAANEG